MNVSKCRGCQNFFEARWSHRVVAASGKAFGMTHVYGRCRRYEMACSMVKKCKLLEEKKHGKL